MIKDLTLNATSREGVGKGPTRRLRAKGFVPVSVYGEGLQAEAVAVNAREIATILRSGSGHNTIFRLALPGQDSGEPATVIIKDFQVDPVRGRLLHADLLRLSMTTATQVSVQVRAVGEPVGVKLEAGILEIQMREIEVECLPGDIPEFIQVNVASMHIGDHVTVADLIYDREKIKVVGADQNQIVAGVLAPRMAEEAPAAAAEASRK